MSVRAAFYPCCFLHIVLASTRLCQADDNAKPESSPPASVEFTVMGTVFSPDGHPAAGAIVRSYDHFDHSKRATVIGMPDSSDARHFQTMLEAAKRTMTSAEIDELIGSLKEDD